MKLHIPNIPMRSKNLPMEGIGYQYNELREIIREDHYGVTNRYLTLNHQPILPIMGEFHFTRYEESEWEEELLKMKAGGVEIVATYIFWIHHEEKQGEWNFEGRRNLRAFLLLCKKIDMKVWLRLGPWSHGECRNGGFPDWLVERNDIRLRCNDEKYLALVRLLWIQIALQARYMMCKDGGPIIGVQIENEYGHCGGPDTQEEGFAHMISLKKMAIELGFEVPYYTATCWGNAYVVQDEFLPVYGGYVDAPWEQNIEEMSPSDNFLFQKFHNDKKIGSDFGKDQPINQRIDIYENPYLTAELGGGLQVTSHRRTYPYPEDILAQTVCMLGSGANLIGYYMYHGGTNPKGKYSTLQESRATGYNNDLPIYSYDFQTLIRESGKLNETYHLLRKVHYLIQDFQKELAESEVFIPEDSIHSPEDMTHLRYSVRHNQSDGSGFLFINNHQRLRHMTAKNDVEIALEFQEKSIILPKLKVAEDECKIIPYHLHMGDTILLATNASLLCRIGKTCVFYTDEEPVYEFRGKKKEVITLSVKEANEAYRFEDKLYLAKCGLIVQESQLYAITTSNKETVTQVFENGTRKTYEIMTSQETVHIHYEQSSEEDECKTYHIQCGDFDCNRLHELYIEIDFVGDRAEIYQDGELVSDWFANGEKWNFAMHRYHYMRQFDLKIYPTKEQIYFDLPLGNGCELVAITPISEYKILVE